MAEALQNVARGIENLRNADIKEGELTKRIESQTAKIPSVTFLNLAVGSMVVSAGLALFADRKPLANFVGLWAPTFLLLGIYNKLVKLEGSDHFTRPDQVKNDF